MRPIEEKGAHRDGKRLARRTQRSRLRRGIDEKHDAYAKACHLMYGNRFDPHAAVCRCGFIGRPRMNRGLAEADADEHNKEMR